MTSERYRHYLELSRQMHAEKKIFSGLQVTKYLNELQMMARRNQCKTMLDYGCGKGLQYEPGVTVAAYGPSNVTPLNKFLEIDEVFKYDPAVPKFEQRPAPGSRFDLVVCTDVIEHIPSEDYPWVFEEIFGFAGRALFMNAAAFPAKKKFADGSNTHVTVREPEWWVGEFTTWYHKFGGHLNEFMYQVYTRENQVWSYVHYGPKPTASNDGQSR